METYNLAASTNKIYQSGFQYFTLKTLRDILTIEKETSLLSVVRRLVSNGVLRKLEKDKYLLKAARTNDFSLANFLYRTSYISLETALNFYGILPQFPYEITSVTPKKSTQKTVDDKIYSYSHIQKSLFWGLQKVDDFLIAEPEKALLDQAHLASKGLRSFNIDEYNLSPVHKSKVKEYMTKFPKTRQFMKIKAALMNYL